jgi:SAM-dependent methyltransferase
MKHHHGYYTGGRYTHTVQRELVPSWLDFAALLRGQPSPRGAEGRPFRFLELGSGMGLGLCLIAAAHPEGQFLGVDLLAEHIAHSRWLAAELGLTNVRFLQADFLDLAADPAPLVTIDGRSGPFAYAVAHGIFTWVAAPVQDALLALTARALQPGGLFYCSYNTLPGWLSRAPIQMLAVQELQRQNSADPAPAFARIFATLKSLLGSADDPTILAHALPTLGPEIDRLEGNPDMAYLCGEYGSTAWQPLAVGQMHPRCQAQQLTFLGSATLPELFDQFLIEPGRSVVQAESDPLIRETLFDLALNQSFRRDLFVKGALPLPAPLRQEALAAVRLQPFKAISGPPTDYVFTTSFGEFHADPSLCQAVEARLCAGACHLGELALELGLELETLLPGLAILLDASRIALERGAAAAAALGPAQAANRRLRQLIQARAPYTHLVAPTNGGSIPLSLLETLCLEAIEQQVPEPDWPLCLLLGLQATGAELRDKGEVIEDPQAQQEKLVEACRRFRQERLPLLQALGAVALAPT